MVAKYKFEIQNEAHSRLVQTQLFKLGFYWGGGGGHTFQHTEIPYLFANGDKTITYVDATQYEHFNQHKGIESILAHPNQLKFLEKLISGMENVHRDILSILENKFYFKRDRDFLNNLLKNRK